MGKYQVNVGFESDDAHGKAFDLDDAEVYMEVESCACHTPRVITHRTVISNKAPP